MKKAVADIEAMKIFDDANAKKEVVYERLKKQGWKSTCLDGDPPPEIKAINDECRRKIKELAAQIDE